MAAIIGLSNREIRSLDDAARNLRRLAELTHVDQHAETADVLNGILKRVSRLYGGHEARQGGVLLDMLREILPQEDEED